MTVPSLSLPSRVWLSWLSAFRILFDGRFAERVAALSQGEPDRALLPERPVAAVSPTVTNSEGSGPTEGALQLLSLLQREGRFVDFVEQELAAFSDADIGAAARVVHEGCRKALHAHAQVRNVRTEAEGSALVLPQATEDVKLVGNLAGSAPFKGVLRHRGWRVEGLTLPTRVGAYDSKIVAQAELELP